MQKSFRTSLNGAQTGTSAIAGLPSALVALLVQLMALSVVLLLVATTLFQQWRIFEWAVLQGLIAASISYPLKLSIWWIPIQLIFTPALVATLALALSPLWFFAGFLFDIVGSHRRALSI